VDAALERARELDLADPLGPFLERFMPTEPGLVYLDGNSLGRLPLRTLEDVRDLLAEQWGRRVVRGWQEGWMELGQAAGDRLATNLLGAPPTSTLLADSTSVCFYKLASAALDARPNRTTIVTDTDNFPTDRYIVEGIAARRGKRVAWIESDPRTGPQPEQVQEAIGHASDDVALVTFSHVSFRSAHVAALDTITELAHDAGALVLWDLCHSAGALDPQLAASDVDLAVGCTYKYLNGGPGAPAFLYVDPRLQGELRQPIWGWLGRTDPFEMAAGYDPAGGIASFITGTPPILGITAARTGIELSIEAGIDAIRAKSIALTEYAIELVDESLARLGVGVGSPREPARRGSHVALVHPDARTVTAQLADRDVITDFRAPDVIRFGLSPLSTTFVDVHTGIKALRDLLVRAV
jgi:kynureninase